MVKRAKNRAMIIPVKRGAALLLSVLVLFPAWGATPEPPLAADGVLDLRGWDLTQASVPLDGEWDFFWKQLVSAPYPAKTLATLPGYWTTDPNLPASGWATYHLRVLLPPGTVEARQVLGLKVTEVLSAFRLSVDGKPVFANGVVGTDETTSRPQYLPGVVFVSPATDQIDVEAGCGIHPYWDSAPTCTTNGFFPASSTCS